MMEDAFRQTGDPVNQGPARLNGRWARLRAHLHAVIFDHGIFRAFYRNWFEVAPGVYRSSQPSPAQLARAARQGIRTVVNLRGQGVDSVYRLERDACEKLGLKMIDITVKSREAPTVESLRALGELFRSIEYPALLHCKSGADRAGLASALYLLEYQGRPIEEAMRQLSWRYGHWRQAKTGVLDHFLEVFREDHARTGIGFERWRDEVYDSAAVNQGFHDNWWMTLMVDRILRRE